MSDAPARRNQLDVLEDIASGITTMNAGIDDIADGVGSDQTSPLLVTGDSFFTSQIPALTASALYSSGNVLGGKLTFANIGGAAGRSGTIIDAVISSKLANTSVIDLLIFHSNPTTTFTNRAAINLDVADFDKLSGIVHIYDWTSLGTPSLGQALSLNLQFKIPTGLTDLYVVPVLRGSLTFGTVSDLKVTLKGYFD